MGLHEIIVEGPPLTERQRRQTSQLQGEWGVAADGDEDAAPRREQDKHHSASLVERLTDGTALAPRIGRKNTAAVFGTLRAAVRAWLAQLLRLGLPRVANTNKNTCDGQLMAS